MSAKCERNVMRGCTQTHTHTHTQTSAMTAHISVIRALDGVPSSKCEFKTFQFSRSYRLEQTFYYDGSIMFARQWWYMYKGIPIFTHKHTPFLYNHMRHDSLLCTHVPLGLSESPISGRRCWLEPSESSRILKLTPIKFEPRKLRRT